MKKKKLKSISYLKKKADKLFSQFIRQRDSHKCYTCGKQLTPQESQDGHYIPRNYLFLRYSEVNNHCQCVGCNVFKKGNMSVYSVRLEEQYGYGILQELEESKFSEVGNTREFLMSIIKKYE